MHYRADIDGLRALAVVAAILSHTGVPEFAGGFVGVDIFFVVSGYLIAGILLEEIRTGRFSLTAFFERRVRRILPVLGAVALFTLVAGWFLLLPRDLAQLGESVAATGLFVSNFLFWRRVEYFDDSARTSPFLHTWTLSVEEQFYVVFPLVLWLIVRRNRAAVLPVLLMLAALSLSASELLVRRAPGAAFFFSPSRAWELLLGAILAEMGLRAPLSGRVREAAGLSGLALLLFSVVTYSERTPFPGVAALMPCVGAALVIVAGAGDGSKASRALATRPMVFVGLLSYSWYLWHWPLLALETYRRARPLQPHEALAVAGFALIIAYASWRLIELPVRLGRGRWPRRRLFAVAAAVTAIMTVAGASASWARGWPNRESREVLALMNSNTDFSPHRPRCHAHDRFQITYAESCVFGAPGRPVHQAIWGDSHGAELAMVLGTRIAPRGESIRQLTYSSCSAGGVTASPNGIHCARYNESMRLAMMRDTSLHTVFLVAQYPEASDPGTEEFFTTFEAAASQLRRAGKRVVLLFPHPKYDFPIPTRLALAARRGDDLSSTGMTRTLFERSNESVLARLERIRVSQHLDVIDPAKTLCDLSKCVTVADGRSLYFDGIHLSLTGARRISAGFDPFIGL